MSMRARCMAVLACAWLLACEPPSTPEPKPDAPAARAKRWVEAEPASHVAWLEAPARALASPESSLAVSAPMSARVLRVHVRPGQRVKRGEPLIELLIPELIKAAGALSGANLRVRAYELRKARLTELVAQGLSRAGELNEVEVNLALAEAERAAARATLHVAAANENQAEKLLNEHGGSFVLRAPSAAMVVRVATRPGDVREPAGGALLELIGEGGVQVEARFAQAPPEGARLVWLSHGAEVALIRDAVSPVAVPEDGSRLVWLHAEDGTRAPIPGSLGRVRVLPAEDWQVVPSAALRPRGSGAAVLVYRGGSEREVRVHVIMRSSNEAIVSGLSPGAQVALDAQAPEREPEASRVP
jgi:cobalt-zinc-cadmium efflux system membrane fusion protein